MEGDGHEFERWGGDLDFNEWSDHDADRDAVSPQWEPTPPKRWNGRRIGMIVGGAVLATLVGVGGVLGVLALAGGGDGEEGPTATTAPDVAATIAPAALEWAAVDATVGFAQRIAEGSDGSFYALSTAPGPVAVWPPLKAVYYSEDGEFWDFAVLDDQIPGGDLAVRDSTVYLIGTAPGFSAIGEAVPIMVSWSDDAGATWDQVSLPSEAVPPAAAGDGWLDVTTSIASSGSGMVAVVQTNYWLDWWSIVPQEVLAGGEVDVRPVEDGVDIIDYSIMMQLEMECEAAGGFSGDVEEEDLPEPCRQLMSGEVEGAVTEHFTWEELGIEGGSPSFSEVFVSSDGAAWEAVDSPFAVGQGLSGLFGLEGGYLAAQWTNMGGLDVWSSSDGRTWDKTEGLPAFEWIVDAGTVAGSDVVLGSRQGRPIVAWSDGAGGWEVVDLSDDAEGNVGNAWLSSGAVGPLGVIGVVVQEGGVAQPVPRIVHAVGPGEWEWIPLDALGTGTGFGYSDWVAVGRDKVLLRYVESGPQGEVSLELIGYPET